MRLVAVEAAKLCLCHVKVVLSHLCLVPVAVFETVLVCGFDLAVRMMTIKTPQRRHRPLCGNIFVTCQTSAERYHLRRISPVAMALQT